MGAFKKEQPKHGDTVLACKHDLDGQAHFFKVPEGEPVMGPDGAISVQWLVCCVPCAELAEFDPMKISWERRFSWLRNEPVIKAPD